MDAIQFGRWLSSRRRRYGWSSQRSLAEATQQEPFLSEYDISEKFLARLEAGHLVHPFRGAVRQRVLALATLLCSTPREVQTYLRVAELMPLSTEEAECVQRLSAYLQAQHSNPVLLLPPRPNRLIGRAGLLDELLHHLATGNSGLYAITGMPGVGKSALAFEAVHRLIANERQGRRLFPHGVAIFTCSGRQDTRGLVTLLQEIAEAFSAPITLSSKATRSGVSMVSSNESHALPQALKTDLADALARARLALAGKRTLLVLDDVGAQFLLRQAREALLAGGADSPLEREECQHGKGRMGDATCKVLITSRYIPAPSLTTYHLHLGPLGPDAALEFFTALVGRSLEIQERHYAEQLCAAIGYLPLAIEAAAASIATAGIPMSLLAARVAEHPLDTLLDGEREVRSTLAQALDALDPAMQQRFALLATLGVSSFNMESAAAIRSAVLGGGEPMVDDVPPAGRFCSPDGAVAISESKAHNGTQRGSVDMPLSQLASTAQDLGQFVRHSLIESVSSDSPGVLHTGSLMNNSTRYHLHPLLRAYALERLSYLEPEFAQTARTNAWAYAQAYLERYSGEVIHLERERMFLLAALTEMWQQQQYPLVVRCVEGLLPLADHLGSYQDRERILLWGIHASQHIRDQYHLAGFLYQLGLLRLCREPFDAVRRVLEESLAVASEAQRPAHPWLWRPFTTLAYMAYLDGENDAVRHFTGTMLRRMQQVDEPFSSSYGFLIHGIYARLLGERDRAYQDISTCLHLLTPSHPACPRYEHVLVMAQTEMARVQGDYVGSYKHTENLIALAKEAYQDCEVADILLDQAEFAYQQGIFAEARSLAQGALTVSDQEDMPHFQARAMRLLYRLSQ
jgi:tetratricopeptide (TPR) repeat protein